MTGEQRRYWEGASDAARRATLELFRRYPSPTPRQIAAALDRFAAAALTAPLVDVERAVLRGAVDGAGVGYLAEDDPRMLTVYAVVEDILAARAGEAS